MMWILAALVALVLVGIVAVTVWCVAVTAIRRRRARDLDMVALRSEVEELEEENSLLRAELETRRAVMARSRAAPAQIPMH